MYQLKIYGSGNSSHPFSDYCHALAIQATPSLTIAIVHDSFFA
jgi:hypothetical protein